MSTFFFTGDLINFFTRSALDFNYFNFLLMVTYDTLKRIVHLFGSIKLRFNGIYMLKTTPRLDSARNNIIKLI